MTDILGVGEYGPPGEQGAMKKQHDFFFKINGWTPEEVPMERLAEYMKDLARLLDSRQRVHVVGIKSGNVGVAMDVDGSHKEEMKQRIRDAAQGRGQRQSMAALRRINEHLYEDGKEGQLSCDGVTILHFPGSPSPAEVEISPFEKKGSFDGKVVSVGVGGNSARVRLLSGNDKVDCLADRDMAKKLAEHLFGEELRVSGTGKRFRNAKGQWKFKQFIVTSFEILDTTPLTTLVERLRSLPGNGWEKLEDPWEELRREREG